MTFDEELAERARELVESEYGIGEKRMFGGVAFLVDGSMAFAVSGEGGLMVRVPADETEALLALPHVGPMDMSGRPVKGWVRVDAAGCEGDGLREWIARGVEHVRTLVVD